LGKEGWVSVSGCDFHREVIFIVLFAVKLRKNCDALPLPCMSKVVQKVRLGSDRLKAASVEQRV
jgi:hypothetical protein